MLLHIFKELDGTLEFPAVDCLGGFPSVLEGDTEEGAPRASTLRGVQFLRSVPDLEGKFG